MTISRKATKFAGFPVIAYQPEVGLVLPTMPRRVFRFDDGKAEKFWAISLERNRLTLEFGKVGDAGETDAQVFPDAAAAQNDYVSLVASIIREGYTEQKQPGDSIREGIISALAANPDDHVARMAFADYLSEQGEPLPAVAYRVDEEVRFGEEGIANLESFLAEPAVGLVQALVVGSCWGVADSNGSNAEVVRTLLEARNRLTNLRALFLGDITFDECEISWLVQSDLTDLPAAFPKLEHFRTRGGNDLILREFEHQHLKSLAFEASNLPREVVRTLGASKLPSLEHLELWLGTERYGANTEVGDLADILEGKHLPALRSLAFKNSEIADDVAVALAGSPILERIRVLDLSLGALGDRGAEALLASPAVAKLEKLDIHHHYVSADVVERLRALGIEVDGRKEDDEGHPQDLGADPADYRYVAHDE
jgi:uncharacterized protein (TIGR02996 family)